jgi:hypothetical protein
MYTHEEQGNSGSRCVKNCRFIRPLSFEVRFDTLASCLKLKKKKEKKKLDTLFFQGRKSYEVDA